MLRRTLPVVAALLASALFVPRLIAGGGDPDAFPAVLHPASRVALVPDAEGVVAEVLVERGARVEAGALLARLESGVERAELELARARAEATAELESAELDLEQREREFARAEALQAEGFETTERYDETRFERARARVAVEAARLEQEIAGRELERARALLARREIRAPFDGVVTERRVEPGQLVIRTAPEPLFELAALEALVADVRLPAERFGSVAAGDTVQVLAAGALEACSAVVQRVDPILDPASHTFRVRIRLEGDREDGAPTPPAGTRVVVRLEEDR